MKRSIDLSPEQRHALLDRYRKDPDPEVRFRSHILLLLDDGHTWATVATLLFCSSRTIDRWVKRFHAEGVEGLAGHKPGRPFRFAADWVAVVVEWVTTQGPARLRLPPQPLVLRGRRPADARELHRRRGQPRDRPPLAASRATWSTAAPARSSGRTTSERQAKLDALRRLLAGLPADETAVFQDEVDINTNPKIGSMWMVKGQQAEVETPGNNEKRYLSGSIHWRTGQVFVTEGQPEAGPGHGAVPGPPGRPAVAGCGGTGRST